jgi:hypothetical protein
MANMSQKTADLKQAINTSLQQLAKADIESRKPTPSHKPHPWGVA